jgi:hypothetical protein
MVSRSKKEEILRAKREVMKTTSLLLLVIMKAWKNPQTGRKNLKEKRGKLRKRRRRKQI